MGKTREKEEDYKNAFSDAYDKFIPWMNEAHRDWEYFISDPYTAAERQELKDNDREILDFNITRRIVKLITGYERRNRLTMKIAPAEGQDAAVAGQLTGLIMPLLENRGGYSVISDAFEMGALVAGLNLIEIYLDSKGNIQFKRKPYNRFLLDPMLSKRDLSDCGYVITYDQGMLIEDVKSLVPGHSTLIDECAKDSDARKLPFTQTVGMDRAKRCTFSTFWERTNKRQTVIANRATGTQLPWQKTPKELKELLAREVPNGDGIKFGDLLATFKQDVETVTLSCFVNDRLVHTGPDPNGINDYPFTAVFGFWYPEFDEMEKKLQGIVRPTRDCRKETSKRYSKILDIIDSQVNSGVYAEEDAFVRKDDIYASGQGRGIWLTQGALSSGNPKIMFRPPANIPGGLFQLNQQIETLSNEIAGVNDSMFGQDEQNAQMSGYLMKLRQGAGLTALQDLFDNLRFSNKQLAFKLCQFIQHNYTPEKVQRVLNQQPNPAIFTEDLTTYDIVPTQGILTESQQQMFYNELVWLKGQGAPITWQMLIENFPTQMPQKFKEMLAQEEKRQQQAQQQQLQEKQILDRMRMAKIAADEGRAVERRANEQEHKADAALARVRTAKEIDEMGFHRSMELIDRVIALENVNTQKQKRAMTKR